MFDIVFTPSHTTSINNVRVCAPISTSDHSSILFDFMQPSVCDDIHSPSKHNLAPLYVFKKCNMKLVSSLLAAVDWFSSFANYVNIDEYWLAFKNVCLTVIFESTPLLHVHRHRRPFPRFLRQAVSKKKKYLWRTYRIHSCLSH